MATHRITRLSFTAGELSPRLYGRPDLDAYARGAARLENMVVSPFGGVEKRQGSKWVCSAHKSDGAVRLFPFTFSTGDCALLEVGCGYIRYIVEEEVIQSEGRDYITVTPWVSNEMVETLRMQQLNDVLYFTCPHIAPHTLSRYGKTDWRLNPIQFRTLPYETELDNYTPLRYTPDTSVVGCQLRIESDVDLFTSAMEGKEYIRMKAFLNAYTVPISIYISTSIHVTSLNRNFALGEPFCMPSSTGWCNHYRCIKAFNKSNYKASDKPDDYPEYFSPGIETHYPVPINGEWTLNTYGTWDGVLELQRNYDSASFSNIGWQTVKRISQTPEMRRNYALSGSEDTEAYYRLVQISMSTDPPNKEIEFMVGASDYEYLLQVMKVGGARTAWVRYAKQEELRPLTSKGETKRWSFAAFGERNGYPSVVEFHQGRLWFASTRRQPQTVWASRVDDFTYFSPGVNVDDPLCLTLASSQQNKIRWMISMRGLVLGTGEGEWVLVSSNNEPISSTNCSFMRQSSIGGGILDAICQDSSIFFIQRGEAKVRELSYALEADGYISADIGLMAEHMLSVGIRDWALQTSIVSHLWCVLYDGSVACMTFNKEQNVLGWQRLKFEGASVMSVCVLPRDHGWDDYVWLVIHRDGNYSIEMVSRAGVYLDSWVERPVRNGVLQDVSHLHDAEVICYEKHGNNEYKTVVDGDIVLPTGSSDSTWIIGRTFTAHMKTLPIDYQETMGYRKYQVKTSLLMSASGLGFEYSADEEEKWYRYDESRHLQHEPFTGYVDLAYFHGGSRCPQVCIRDTSAKALNLLAMAVELHISS